MRSFSILNFILNLKFIKKIRSHINSAKIFKKMDAVSAQNTLSVLDLNNSIDDAFRFHLLRELSNQKKMFITIPNDSKGLEIFNEICQITRMLEKKLTVVFAEPKKETKGVIDSFEEFKHIDFTRVHVFVMLTAPIYNEAEQRKVVEKINGFFNDFNDIVVSQKYVTSTLFILDQSSPVDTIIEIINNTKKRKLNPNFNTNYIALKSDREWNSLLQDRNEHEKVINGLPYSIYKNLDKFNLLLK